MAGVGLDHRADLGGHALAAAAQFVDHGGGHRRAVGGIERNHHRPQPRLEHRPGRLGIDEDVELGGRRNVAPGDRSEEHTSELQSLMRISYAVFCLKKKKTHNTKKTMKHIYSKQETTHIMTTATS